MSTTHGFRRGRLLGTFAVLLLAGAVQPAAAEDETQACDPNGQAIAYGDVRAGCTIEAAADVDIFTFVGAVGDEPRLVLTRTSNVFANVCAEIRAPAPDNSLLAGPTCQPNTLQFNLGPLLLAGVHQIIVSENGNNDAFNFNLSLERIFPLRSPTSIGPGDVVGHQILPAADMDTFGFNANIGDQFRLVLTRTSNVFASVCAEIRAPDDSLLAGPACHPNTLQFDLGPLPLAGVHQIIVTDNGNDNAFDYNLSLNCLSGTCANRPPTCIVAPSYAGGTLTLDFTVGSPAPTEWHVAVLAAGQVFTLWRIPIPIVDPAVTFQVPIPGFPALGTIGVLSTLTAGPNLVCANLRTVQTP